MLRYPPDRRYPGPELRLAMCSDLVLTAAVLKARLTCAEHESFFANKIHFFANFVLFFAKWDLSFAKWGLFFANCFDSTRVLHSEPSASDRYISLFQCAST